MKRIVLSGINTVNKGAELMLYAILQQIEKKFPDAEVYVPLYAVRQGLPYIKTNLKLREKPYASLKKIAGKFHIPGILRRLKLPYSFLVDLHPVKQADLFIDASGLNFSDQWNPSAVAVKDWEISLQGYSKQNTRIVFLPQVFGPVELENTKKLFALLSEYADLIMPREQVSLEYLQNQQVDSTKIFKFTDFTSVVNGSFPSNYEHLRGGICVIPNIRMIDKGGITMGKYIDFLIKVINVSINQGQMVYLLNHEGTGDERLAYECSKKLDGQIEVVTGLNALEVKGLIASSYLCVSSRFHGVASALNSCVPCLSTSWSYKYEELYKDYGMKDCVLNLNSIDASIAQVKEYMGREKNQQTREYLRQQVPMIQKETERMWELIWDKVCS